MNKRPKVEPQKKTFNTNPLPQVNQQQKHSINNQNMQKKTIKLDLKLEYLLNEIASTRKFKEFLQDLNQSTKELIRNDNQSQTNKNYEDPSKKKKNSFSFNENMLKNNLSNLKQQNNNVQNLKRQTSQDQQNSDSHQLKTMGIDLEGLHYIMESMQARSFQINNHTRHIRKKMCNSSIWDDKFFYDLTEGTYHQKMEEIEQRLQVSEVNLQEKQRQKRILNTQGQVSSVSFTRVAKYSFYDEGSKQNELMLRNIDVKRRVAKQMKEINQLYSGFESEIQSRRSSQHIDSLQNVQSKTDKVKNIKSHPIVVSAEKLKQELSKLVELSSKGKSSTESSLQKYELPSKRLYSSIQLLNTQILKKEHSKTKSLISKLKHQTQSLQSAISQLQAFKALTLLRNKHKQSQIYNQIASKSSKPTQKIKGTFKDEILRLILEHQFLAKNLTIQVETKFAGLQKKNVNSASNAQLDLKLNYFPNIKKNRKCHSQINLGKQKSFDSEKQQQSVSKSPRKKSGGLKVVSSGKSNKKQVGSSAETNP